MIRQGHNYQFSSTAQGLKKSLIVDFKLSGNDLNGKKVEMKLKSHTVSTSMRQFEFRVS